MVQQTKKRTVKSASNAGVYDEIEALVAEMRGQEVMPASDEHVYMHLKLYDSPVEEPRYYVGITIKRFF